MWCGGLRESVSGGVAALTRRRLIAAGGAALGGAALAACGRASAPPPAPGAPSDAFTGGGALSILLNSHFIPAYDAWVDKWAAEWGAQHKVDVSADHILSAQLAEKIAAEVAAQAGHDVIRFTRAGELPLYHEHLVEVGEQAKQIGQRHGWVNPLAEQMGMYQGVWKGLPEYFLEFSASYRKDLFDQNGLKPVDTWDDLLKAGSVLKGKGNPIGIAINQKSNDANVSWLSLLWGYGASYVGKDGKTITINSPETKQALKLALELYSKAMTNEVLSWDDTGNNQFLASGRGAWIHNPISGLRTIEKQDPELAKKIALSNVPAGPKGRLVTGSSSTLSIMKWAKSVPAAKAFLSGYFGSYLDAVKASEGYNQPVLQEFRKKPMAILGEDPRFHFLQDWHEYFRVFSYPGPPTPAAGEVESNWIIPLMVARAVTDGNVDGAVSWAEQKLKAIYAKHK